MRALFAVFLLVAALLPVVNAAPVSAAEQPRANRLANSSSPYLLQHAYNPVDWYPWGEEAFAKARRENKPILLSIGYSTCYWCHVMEREVFEKPEIAKLMNETFVSIKIDREQRPDVDEIYMIATQLLTKSGGWPNNVFVTPDLKPFFAGMYFPPEDFASIVGQIKDKWKTQQADITAQAEEVANVIVKVSLQDMEAAGTAPPDAKAVDTLLAHYRDYYDNKLGGFYQPPKFPTENALLFLLDAHRVTGNKNALDMARGSLQKMADGGIHDHVGGGFHRYTVDGAWRIPHFEKMLYNQALLGRAYTEIYRLSNAPADRQVAEGLFDFVLRQMTDKDGGFMSALDAETDAVEGAYYVWTDAELKKALDAASYAWLTKSFGLAEIPENPGHKKPDGKVVYFRQPLTDAEAVRKAQIMDVLRKVRDERKMPRRDDKIVTAWNGLMIDAYARAGEVLRKPEYARAAVRAADFMLANVRKPDGTLSRTWRQGKAEIGGYFEDYAFLIQGLATTYRVTKDEKYLRAAKELTATARRLFWDTKYGGYYFTDGSETLLVRKKNAEDAAMPSGNAVMAHALLDLYETTNDPQFKQGAEDVLKAFGHAMNEAPRAYTYMVGALMRLQPASVAPQTQVASAGPATSAMDSKARMNVSLTDFKREGNKLAVTALLEVQEGWHINANPVTLDFLIPTSVDLREDSGKTRVEAVKYPPAKAAKTPLGDINIYEGNVAIPVEAELPADAANVRVLVRAQACQDTTCLAPSDWAMTIKLK